MVPLKYNVRNLRVRWKTTLMTMLGTGLVVWSSCILFGLVDGLEHSLTISGEPLDLIVMRPGSTNETTGGFESAGRPAPRPPGHRPRRVGPSAGRRGAAQYPDRRPRERHPHQRDRPRRPARLAAAPSRLPIIQGRDLTRQGRMHREPQHVASFQGGPDRRPARIRRQGGLPGRRHLHGRRELGRERGLGGLQDVDRNTGRDGSVSCVQLRAPPRRLRQLRDTIENDTRFKLAAIPETVYFQNQSRSSIFLKGAGTLIAVLLTFGAMFAAANTMFAAVSTDPRDRHDAP